MAEDSKDNGIIIRDIEYEGATQRSIIDQVLRKYHISLPKVASAGVLSLDVGTGPEIAAFAPFHPKPFVVTERAIGSSTWGEIDKSLEIMKAKHPAVSILRNSVPESLSHLSANRTAFGLVTYLYLFPPDGGNYERLRESFTAIGGLLKPGGVMVASLEPTDPMRSYGTEFIRAGYHSFRTLGYFVDAPVIEGGNPVGGLFLVAQRPA